MRLEPMPVPAQEDELARRWLAQRHRQVRPARPASAVVVVRDGADGVEVLLRHRAGRTPLGRVGFPGGALIDSDADTCAWFGPEPAEWARMLGIVDRRRVRQHVVAAVRELFEDSGMLLAGRTEGEIAADAHGETWGAHRSSLEHGETSLPDLLDARGLGLRTDLLRPFGRWLSVRYSPRRFDTVVFAAALPPQQVRVDRPDAATHHAWLCAARILAEPSVLPGPDGWLGEHGVIALEEATTPMTQCILRQVAEHRTAAGFLLSLRAGRGPIPRYEVHTEAEDTHAGAADDPPTGCLWAVPERMDGD